jgi:hypothetical protein
VVQGDGAYGDGPSFHWDYYNSFVIHPMLVDVAAALAAEDAGRQGDGRRIDERAKRYAAVQERMIGPDGTFPPIGRSLAYRCGAFHLLAQSALRRALPDEVKPSQARAALTAVMTRTLDAPETFDAAGWLRIGFCGTSRVWRDLHLDGLAVSVQRGVPAARACGERSLLGDAAVPFTQQRAWSRAGVSDRSRVRLA